MSRADDFDYQGIEVLTNNGQQLTGMALVFDDSGRPIRLAVAYSRGGARVALFPVPGESVSSIQWAETHGQAEMLADAQELLSDQRLWLRDRDVVILSRPYSVYRRFES